MNRTLPVGMYGFADLGSRWDEAALLVSRCDVCGHGILVPPAIIFDDLEFKLCSACSKTAMELDGDEPGARRE
jgi:hypothetical protein